MKQILFVIGAAILVVEEFIWDYFVYISRIIVKILHINKFDIWLASLSPFSALVSLIIPVIIITPFNFLALHLLANGAIIQGILLEIAVKIFSTVFIGHIFTVTKSALLQFEVINFIYCNMINIIDTSKRIIKVTWLYNSIVTFKQRVKQFMNFGG